MTPPRPLNPDALRPMYEALREMVATHPRSTRRFGGEGSIVRRVQEDQEASVVQALAAIALAEDGGCICPECRGERRVNGRLCLRCSGTAQIPRSHLRAGESEPFVLADRETV